MIETIVIALFAAGLILCIFCGWHVLVALVFGCFLFVGYALWKQFTVRQIWKMSINGVRTIRTVLLLMLLIGMLTATWRASGTVACIVYFSVGRIWPPAFLVMSFLLCCLMSFLTGTAFGACATMGVVCMTMANALGIPAIFSGGAILSGIFFGDRCSPMSTSALLVAGLTQTDIYENMKGMVRTAAVPFILTCLIYLAIGLFTPIQGQPTDVRTLFAQHFQMHWILLLPAVLIIVLSCLKVRVRTTMLLSIATACVLFLTIQKGNPAELAQILFCGYQADAPELAAMMNGGGILSMWKVMAIIFLSGIYAGIFQETGLLDGLKKRIALLEKRITPFGGVTLTSVVTCAVSCNQTLAIILSHQLCGDCTQERSEMAMFLENTAVVIAPLIPWSIAGAVPMETIGAPVACLTVACYLYLIPLWNGFLAVRYRKKQGKSVGLAS